MVTYTQTGHGEVAEPDRRESIKSNSNIKYTSLPVGGGWLDINSTLLVGVGFKSVVFPSGSHRALRHAEVGKGRLDIM